MRRSRASTLSDAVTGASETTADWGLVAGNRNCLWHSRHSQCRSTIVRWKTSWIASHRLHARTGRTTLRSRERVVESGPMAVVSARSPPWLHESSSILCVMRLVWFSIFLLAACSVPARKDPDEVGRAGSARTRDAAAEVADQPSVWVEIGRSLRGLPIRKRVVGVGPRKVIWVGGIHGNEREGAVATESLAAAFLAADDLEFSVTLTIVEDINPDGSDANTRGNANGVDLNRNFPASNARPGSEPLSEPESRVLHDLIEEVRPDTVLVAHSWGIKPRGPKEFINFDGPAERLARIFSGISGYVVQPSPKLGPTPGSLGSWVGIDRQIPILTIEYMRGKDPREAWLETREAILAVIRG
jgi:hypothetical protein